MQEVVLLKVARTKLSSKEMSVMYMFVNKYVLARIYVYMKKQKIYVQLYIEIYLYLYAISTVCTYVTFSFKALIEHMTRVICNCQKSPLPIYIDSY